MPYELIDEASIKEVVMQIVNLKQWFERRLPESREAGSIGPVSSYIE